MHSRSPRPPALRLTIAPPICYSLHALFPFRCVFVLAFRFVPRFAVASSFGLGLDLTSRSSVTLSVNLNVPEGRTECVLENDFLFDCTCECACRYDFGFESEHKGGFDRRFEPRLVVEFGPTFEREKERECECRFDCGCEFRFESECTVMCDCRPELLIASKADCECDFKCESGRESDGDCRLALVVDVCIVPFSL